MESDREALLDSGSDDDATLNRIGHLSARIEILRRKVSDRDAKLQEAEKELPAATSAALSQFAGLHRVYVQWVFESERTKFLSQLGATPGQLALEQITLCSKPVLEAKQLEPNDPAACQRLLDALPADFVPPPWRTATEQPDAPPEEIGLPWDDGTGQLQVELKKLEAEGATLADIFVRLKARHPRFFKSQAEVLKMLNPLPPLETGVVGTTKMIGDTFSTEEQFKAKIAARRMTSTEGAFEQFSHA
jgi:hypothetical protein